MQKRFIFMTIMAQLFSKKISGQQSGKLKNDFQKLFRKTDYKPLVNVI